METIERADLLVAVEQAADGVVITNTDGNIIYVNPAFLRMTGYTREETLRHHTRILKSGLQTAATYEELWNTIRSGRTWSGELVNRRKDGTLYHEAMRISPVVGMNGETVSYIAIKHDVTQERNAEKVLRQSLADKTLLLQEVHHRVKNNLQVICSLLSMQIDFKKGDLYTGALKDAHARVSAISLVHEQIYRSEAPSDLNFGEYVESLSERLFSVHCVNPSRIRLETSLEAVLLDLDQAIPCGLILNELISNSLKHAFPGEREGVIRVSLKMIGNGYVELAVADNGIGVPVDFELEHSRSFGLQIVHTLIRQLHADMVVDGECGATFRFGWTTVVRSQARLPRIDTSILEVLHAEPDIQKCEIGCISPGGVSITAHASACWLPRSLDERL